MRLKYNIKKLRIRQDMSQEDLASWLGLSGKTSVAAYESGRAQPTVKGLVKMKKIFGVSIDDLILKKF